MAPPPSPPRLVYDDDCGFCTRSAEWVARRADVELVAFSDLMPDQRARLPENWRQCAHLLTDDAVYSCGEAMERAFALTGAVPRDLVRAARSDREAQADLGLQQNQEGQDCGSGR